MRIYNRPFDEKQNDYKKMWEFLVQDYSDKKDQFIWTIGRLGDWKYGCWNEQKCFPSFMRKNAQVWLNQEELVGFVISENCDNGFTVFAKKGYEFLYSEMLQWVKSSWKDREGEMSTQASEYSDEYIKILEKEGFVWRGQEEISRLYKLSDKVKEGIILDSEFTIEDMLQHPDLEGKAILYNDAWRNGSKVTSYDMLRYEYNRESPCFHPKFDLSIVNKNGLHVASCVAFIDYQNHYAEIEKVCSHSEYKRKGLAEAVIRECFRRVYNEGVEYAYIGGSSVEAKGLYGELGAMKTWYLYDFSLPK
ncbi:MAG TPA: GNAT family N-acetyltransferase [Lachnospiraceae bacterium]|nr:GNAT family N-acetyltransferase [Lachnospiraceae bacterium]